MGLRVFRFPGSTTPTMVRRTGQNRPVLQKAHSTPFYIIVFDVASYMFLTSLSWASKAFENKACYRNLSFFCDEEKWTQQQHLFASAFSTFACCQISCLIHPFSQTWARASDGLFPVQLFVLQIVLWMGRFARNFLCSKSCSGWVVSRATFCAPNRAPEGSFRVQLFVLQIVLWMGRFACNFLCSKSCSGKGRFACNFLCSKSCSGRAVSRATFCAPNRAPDGPFRVQLFVLQIVPQIGLFAEAGRFVIQMMPEIVQFFATRGSLAAAFACSSPIFCKKPLIFRAFFCAINRAFFGRF